MTGGDLMREFVRSRVARRTLGCLAIAVTLIAMAIARRRVLYNAASQDWARRSASSMQVAGGSARTWAAEQKSRVRLLGTSAARNPALFDGAAALHPAMTAAALSQRLAAALTQLNQASGRTGVPFAELWVTNQSGRLVGSASRREPPAIVNAAALAANDAHSIAVVGPFPLNGNQLGVAFVQPVRTEIDVRRSSVGGYR